MSRRSVIDPAPGMAARTVVLYTRRDCWDVHSITATVSDAGVLALDEFDLENTVSGPNPSLTTHERTLQITPGDIPRLLEVLGRTPDDDVLEVIRACYGDGTFAESLTPLVQRMEAAGIAYNLHAWA